MSYTIQNPGSGLLAIHPPTHPPTQNPESGVRGGARQKRAPEGWPNTQSPESGGQPAWFQNPESGVRTSGHIHSTAHPEFRVRSPEVRQQRALEPGAQKPEFRVRRAPQGRMIEGQILRFQSPA